MSNQPIEDCVRHNLENYFDDIDGLEPSGMHHMLIRSVENRVKRQVQKHWY